MTVHHLQEPIRMMSVYTEILQLSATGRLDEEAQQAVDFLKKAALQMQTLLDGLGELAAATPEAAVKCSTLRLELPLRQALLLLEPELKAADARVSYAHLPTVWGDFDRLQLVFQHLIRNSVRYRGPQPPEISITARSLDDECVLEVRDNGPGVPAEFHERIFELYARLHGKGIPGNGLGLSICRAIVEGHGGRMWVESEPGDGACFLFTMPLSRIPV